MLGFRMVCVYEFACCEGQFSLAGEFESRTADVANTSARAPPATSSRRLTQGELPRLQFFFVLDHLWCCLFGGRNEWKEFMSFAQEVKKAEKVRSPPPPRQCLENETIFSGCADVALA